MGLATEKACAWLSANITGKVPGRGVTAQVFQKWTGRKLEATLGETGLRASWQQGRAGVGMVSLCRAALVTFSVLPLTCSTDQKGGESGCESHASSPGS